MVLSNCGAREDSFCKSLRQQGDQTSQMLKEINPEHSLEELTLKLQYFACSKELTRWKRPWCWERLREGEEGKRGWDGRMAWLIQWTWIWANSRRQWRTGESGKLQSMGSQSLTWLSGWTILDLRLLPGNPKTKH